MTDAPKKIQVGPKTNNTCCVCCDKCWDLNEQSIWELNTDMKCQKVAGPGGDHTEGSCYPIHTGVCPASCCACPPMGDLCLQLTVYDDDLTTTKCPTVHGTEFRLTADPYGVDICKSNPTTHVNEIDCFREGTPYADMTLLDGIQMYDNDWEKWGWHGTICDGLEIADCDSTTEGEILKISLCCCDVPNETILATKDTKADCHTCSYRLTFEWETHDDDEYCTCPDKGNDDPDCVDEGLEAAKITPAHDEADPITMNNPQCDFDFMIGQCITGNPSPGKPFILQYIFPNRWWNCDCCQNGCTHLDHNVNLIATITEVIEEDDCAGDSPHPWTPGVF